LALVFEAPYNFFTQIEVLSSIWTPLDTPCSLSVTFVRVLGLDVRDLGFYIPSERAKATLSGDVILDDESDRSRQLLLFYAS